MRYASLADLLVARCMIYGSCNIGLTTSLKHTGVVLERRRGGNSLLQDAKNTLFNTKLRKISLFLSVQNLAREAYPTATIQGSGITAPSDKFLARSMLNHVIAYDGICVPLVEDCG